MRKIHLDKAMGFTLVELIAVLVILGLVAGIGSQFIVTTIDSYDAVQKRTKLMNRGRVVIEQMTRQLRSALPNSLRVSGSGNCVEFLPLLGGTNYIGSVPDSNNLAAATSSISTAPFTLSSTGASHAIVGALASSEIYATGSPNARVSTGLAGAGPHSTIPLSSSHRFLRNSTSQRVFLADDPVRFCLIGSTLYEYSGYGLVTSGLTDVAPGGSQTAIMGEDVSTSSQAFSLSAGTEDVNTALTISLDFNVGGQQATLSQEVLVRNVP